MKDVISNEVCAINCVWDGQYMSIPIGGDNRHYQEILVWAAIDGNTIADAD